MMLLDTNILVYAVNTAAPQHRISRALVEAAQARRIEGVVFPQILLEFYAVITDSRRVDKPLEAQEAWRQVELLRLTLPVCDGGLQALDRLREVLEEERVAGGDIFDAFLVAQMRACNIAVICTYDVKHFRGYKGIMAYSPDSVALLHEG